MGGRSPSPTSGTDNDLAGLFGRCGLWDRCRPTGDNPALLTVDREKSLDWRTKGGSGQLYAASGAGTGCISPRLSMPPSMAGSVELRRVAKRGFGWSQCDLCPWEVSESALCLCCMSFRMLNSDGMMSVVEGVSPCGFEKEVDAEGRGCSKAYMYAGAMERGIALKRRG